MKPNPSHEERIAKLENEVQATKKTAEKYEADLKNLRQQYADDLYTERQLVRELQQECKSLQHDYNQLRVQKGGFGLKVLMLTGMLGTLVGILTVALYFVLLQPKSNQQVVFEEYRDANLFNYERAISQGDFEQVERDMAMNMERKEYQLINSEIEFAKKLVGAAKRRCE